MAIARTRDVSICKFLFWNGWRFCYRVAGTSFYLVVRHDDQEGGVNMAMQATGIFESVRHLRSPPNPPSSTSLPGCLLCRFSISAENVIAHAAAFLPVSLPVRRRWRVWCVACLRYGYTTWLSEKLSKTRVTRSMHYPYTSVCMAYEQVHNPKKEKN
ncbi:hypothetical protein LX32DRAFT_53550 [Colletotrichum zoysiae]|uniref:Uncharacterized protein n=1 Tax=Colletotrichum zoysiae TaxID=1216348 RepID=A0AAD9HC00_9PEZI|nr:hypothetical protein LX32DRAFT_53550 [Colletotrichum zoysiae]